MKKKSLLLPIVCLSLCLFLMPLGNAYAVKPTSPGVFMPPYVYNGVTYTKALLTPDWQNPNGAYWWIFLYNGTMKFSAPYSGFGLAAPENYVGVFCAAWNSTCTGTPQIYDSTRFGPPLANRICLDTLESNNDIYQAEVYNYQNQYYHCGFHFVDTSTLVVAATDFFDPRLTVVRDPEEGGTVTGNGINCNGVPAVSDCQESYPEGQIVELTAQENSGYVLDYWLENGNVRLGNPPIVLSITMDATKTVTAKFTPILGVNVHISPSASGNKVLGTVESQTVIDCPTDCLEQFDQEVNITLTAKRKPGYKFVRWEDDNSLELSTANPYTFEIAYAHEVYAIFEPDGFELEFPLEDRHPYKVTGQEANAVSVTAVMDHSLQGGYYTGGTANGCSDRDSRIVAYNGIVAEGAANEVDDGDCVYSYNQINNNPFPQLNYIWGNVVSYDEHPGYDFDVVDYVTTNTQGQPVYGEDGIQGNGDNVLAPARGKLRWATSDPVDGSPATYGTFYIEHQDAQGNDTGYSTWFLHCERLHNDIVTEMAQTEPDEKGAYAYVEADDHIAEAGSKGTGGSHLHFEVRMDGNDDANVIDPYAESLWEQAAP